MWGWIVISLGAAYFVVDVVYLLVSGGETLPIEIQIIVLIGCEIFFIYLGVNGNEMTAKNYLEKGWVFAEPESEATLLGKTKWHINGEETVVARNEVTAMASSPTDPTSKSGLIIGCGLGLGMISFLAGILGPIFLDPGSNQGPLLGIFITGPLGFVLGLVLGTLWSSWRDKTGNLRTEMNWLFAIWPLSALIYLFLLVFGGFVLLMVLGVQIAIVIVGGVLVAAAQKRPAILPVTTTRRIILIVAASAMTLMNAFPPVKEPGRLFIFLLDSRLDASMHVPDYSIDPFQLLLQWAFITSIALAMYLLVGLRSRGPWG